MIPVPEGLRGHEEILRIAEEIAPELTGLAPPLSAWVDPSPMRGHRVGAAADQAVVAGLLAQAEEASASVVGIAPWWSAAQRATCKLPSRRVHSVVSVAEPDSVTVLRYGPDRFVQADTWAPLQGRAAMSAVLKRQALAAEEACDRAVIELNLDEDPDPACTSCTATFGGPDLPFGRWARVMR
jgi:hypothetical protein